MALVLKLWKRANMSTKGQVWALPQIKVARKQIDVTSKRHAKALIFKITEASKHHHEGACQGLSSNKGSMPTNRRDFERARNGARPQIKEASKLDLEGECMGLSSY